MIRVTIACCESLIYEANQLASCLGLCAEDLNTYGEPLWEDEFGNKYSLVSALVSNKFFQLAGTELVAPEWGSDLPSAQIAQQALVINSLLDPEIPIQKASPVKITVVIHEDSLYAISLLGVELSSSKEKTEEILEEIVEEIIS